MTYANHNHKRGMVAGSRFPKSRDRFWRLAAYLVILLLASNSFAQSNWSFSATMQTTQGKYIFENSTSTYYFYSTLRYQNGRFSLSAGLPFIYQNSDLVSRTGGMFLPTGDAHHSDGGTGGSHHVGRMGSESAGTDFNFGPGDVSTYAEYQLITDTGSRPAIAATVQVKFPTASTEFNYGTGEFDYGVGLSMRKRLGTTAAFFDLGYTVIGDPAGVEYKDPLIAGAGLGKFFGDGRYAVLFYYQTYSEVFDGLEPPSQMSLGFTYRMNTSMFFSLDSLVGLSETSPDFSLSGGVQWLF